MTEKREQRRDCDYLRPTPTRLELLCGTRTDDDDQEEGEPGVLGSVLDHAETAPKPMTLRERLLGVDA